VVNHFAGGQFDCLFRCHGKLLGWVRQHLYYIPKIHSKCQKATKKRFFSTCKQKKLYIYNMLVKIWTDSFIITGEIDTLRDERLTDYIRENKDFIAVTQVRVSDRSEKDLFRTHCLNVSTSHIEIILPAE
jgi:hypothetical protein